MISAAVEHGYARGDVVQEGFRLTDDYSFRSFRHNFDTELSCL